MAWDCGGDKMFEEITEDEVRKQLGLLGFTNVSDIVLKAYVGKLRIQAQNEALASKMENELHLNQDNDNIDSINNGMNSVSKSNDNEEKDLGSEEINMDASLNMAMDEIDNEIQDIIQANILLREELQKRNMRYNSMSDNENENINGNENENEIDNENGNDKHIENKIGEKSISSTLLHNERASEQASEQGSQECNDGQDYHYSDENESETGNNQLYHDYDCHYSNYHNDNQTRNHNKIEKTLKQNKQYYNNGAISDFENTNYNQIDYYSNNRYYNEYYNDKNVDTSLKTRSKYKNKSRKGCKQGFKSSDPVTLYQNFNNEWKRDSFLKRAANK